MKINIYRTLSTCLACIILLSCGNEDAPPSTKEAALQASLDDLAGNAPDLSVPTTAEFFGKMILSTFIEKSQSRFVDIAFPSKTEWVMILKGTLPHSTTEELEDIVSKNYDNEKGQLHDSWLRVYLKGQEAGVNWKLAEYLSVEGEISQSRASGEQGSPDDIPIKLWFEVDGKSHHMVMHECIFLGGRWFCTGVNWPATP